MPGKACFQISGLLIKFPTSLDKLTVELSSRIFPEWPFDNLPTGPSHFVQSRCFSCYRAESNACKKPPIAE